MSGRGGYPRDSRQQRGPQRDSRFRDDRGYENRESRDDRSYNRGYGRDEGNQRSGGRDDYRQGYGGRSRNEDYQRSGGHEDQRYGDSRRQGNQPRYDRDRRSDYQRPDRRNEDRGEPQRRYDRGYEGNRGGHFGQGNRGRQTGGYQSNEPQEDRGQFYDARMDSSASTFSKLNLPNEVLMTQNEIRLNSFVEEYNKMLLSLRDSKSKSRYERMTKAMILPPFAPGSHVGTNGRSVDLKTNFFQVTDTSNTWRIYVYNVKFFHPEFDSNYKMPTSVRHKILKDYFNETFNGTYIFDGMETLYSTLHVDGKTVKKCEYNNKIVDVTVMFTKVSTSNELPALQAMNVLMKKVYYLMGMKPLGRSFFDTNPDSRKFITNKVDALYSVKSSVSYYEKSSLLYLLDIHYKFEQNETVLQVINQIRKEVGREMEGSRGSREEREMSIVKTNLKGQTVRTTYNNLTYNIHDVDFSLNPLSTFECNDRQVSYKDYVERYKCTVREVNQPLLVIKNKKKGEGFSEFIYLIPELCRMTGLPRSMLENLNAAKEASSLTKAAPTKRVDELRVFRDRFDEKPEIKLELNKLGIKIDKNMVAVKGRTLEPPVILFSGWDVEKKVNNKYVFGGAIFSSTFLRNVRADKGVHIIALERYENVGDKIRSTLTSGLRSIGINTTVAINYITDDSAESYCNFISNHADSADLIICILPNNTASRYNAIKIQSSIITPVPTQVILEKTMNFFGRNARGDGGERLKTMIYKVIPQIAAKIGSEPWGCKIPQSLRHKSMYIGIDTYHDAARKELSAAAFVASLNGTCTRMFSRVSYQSKSLELHTHMRPNVAEACVHWYKANKRVFPDHLFFFRDGVGDGQLEEVVEHEIQQIITGIEDARNALDIDKEIRGPTITFIVVKKRIGARFYMDVGGGEFVNPPPGTVVDTRVTRSDWYDFFLVSHMPREGTVNPVHYNVIYDTLKISPDDIQQLAYRLSWLYYNYTGSISIPSVCGYAHKLAYLSGLNLSSAQVATMRPELSEKLFYI